jgi:hypothetical protein
MLNAEELEALERVVQYTLMNEEISYEEWLEEGGNPNDHIYMAGITLDNYIKGLHSTGSTPNA